MPVREILNFTKNPDAGKGILLPPNASMLIVSSQFNPLEDWNTMTEGMQKKNLPALLALWREELRGDPGVVSADTICVTGRAFENGLHANRWGSENGLVPASLPQICATAREILKLPSAPWNEVALGLMLPALSGYFAGGVESVETAMSASFVVLIVRLQALMLSAHAWNRPPMQWDMYAFTRKP